MDTLTDPEYKLPLSTPSVKSSEHESVSQHDSRLLRLPSELRNRIYEATLIQPRPIRICDGQSEAVKRCLLGVCRQIHRESEGIYYSGNTFITEPAYYECGRSTLSCDLVRWLRRLGPRRAALLRDVRVCHRLLFVPRAKDLDEDTAELAFIGACVNRLINEKLWLALPVLRVRVGVEYLSLCELGELVGPEEKTDDKRCSAPWPPKHPWIRGWRFDTVKGMPWTCHDNCSVCDTDKEPDEGPII